MIMAKYETVIGLEVHVQLKTDSKIFCASSAEFGATPNLHIDPLSFGLPGSLPVLNRKVVEYAIMLGLATDCEIRPFCRFARKHYFYPDLPKGYQISQFEEPICERGHIDIHLENAMRTVGITRIHMEEDAGKNIHDARKSSSLVDLNRAGVPLLEVVSQPDLRSSQEAVEYLKSLRQIVRFLDISDGNMEEGSLRCDANISLRPMGEMKFGTRTEIKNLNSFRFVEQALEYEAARQLAILKSGASVEQETRLFDTESAVTMSMRSKEESADYRYFPDPDLAPLEIAESWIESLRSKMPPLPAEYRKKLKGSYSLSDSDVSVLISEKNNIDFFEEVVKVCSKPRSAFNWISTELFGQLNRSGLAVSESPVSALHLGELIKLIDEEVISGKMAKTVFQEMFKSGKKAEEIIAERGLKQITSEDEILSMVRDAFDSNPAQLKEFLGGKDKLQSFFVGQVMKSSQGSANPRKVNELIKMEAKRRQGEGSGEN